MRNKNVISTILCGLFFLIGGRFVHGAPTLLTWSSFSNVSDLSGLTGNLENGQPANIFGGVGSGIAWAGGNSFVMVPDRGPNAITWNTNVDNTTSFISRLQNVTLDLKQTSPGVFNLTPILTGTTLLYGTTPLNYNYYNYGATSTVVGGNYYFNGRSDNFGAGTSANTSNARFDPEAVRVSGDGRYVYLSDEYGPYVYQFDRETGMRTKSFMLPGNLSVSNQSSQASVEIASNTIGRVANKGMEGLAISPDGSTLFGFMQGPLIQDGGNGAYYNRIVKIDIASGQTWEYAYNNQVGGTNPSSEILAINNNEFLVLERDSKGLGESNAAVVKDLIKIDLAGATDVTGLSGSNALAPYAVTGTVFLDIVAAMNAAGITSSNIPAKLESIAWGQDMMINGTNTHILYMGNDNDFTASSSGPSVVYVFGVTDADLGGSIFRNQSISFQLGGDLYIGSNSTVPSVSYTSGTNFYNNVYVGYDVSASNNRLIVANPGTMLTNAGDLYVGFSGSGNVLTISNSGAVIDRNGFVGFNATSSNNTVLVTGSNSVWTNAGDLNIGYHGGGNSLVISTGGKVYNNYGNDYSAVIGYYSSGNSVLITGSNSLWSIGSDSLTGGQLSVGADGSNNTLVVSKGGKLDASISNNVSVFIGNGIGSYNSIVISNGGSAESYQLTIGNYGFSNSVLITGTNSLWNNADSLYLGSIHEGYGNVLIISNGGRLFARSGSVGLSDYSSNNSVVVTGAGSLWSNAESLMIGNGGSGNSMLISAGGKVYSSYGYIGHEATATGNLVTVTGSNSAWINSGDLYVGYAGQSNRLVISAGGYVSNVNGFDDGISPTDAFNSVLVTGAGSRWQNSGNLTFGLGGHDNSLVVSNGGVVTVGGNSVIGDQSTATNNSVLVTGANSLLSNSGTLTIGNLGSGTVSVANGGRIVASRILIGQYGDLDFGRYQQSDSAGSVVGDILFIASNDENYGINFNQTNTLIFSNNVSGSGWVCALGTGTTIMSGSNTYSQYTKIDAGTVVAASTNALGSGSLGIGGYADRAVIRLATNLTVGDFIWRSNGVVSLTAGSQSLTVAAMTNLVGTNGGNAFEFLNPVLNNATNTLISYASQTGFTTDSFSVEGVSGYSFSITNNSVQVYIATNANIVVTTPVVITNAFSAGSVTIAGPSGCLSGTGPINAPVTNGGTVIPGSVNGAPGTMTINGNYTQTGAGTLQINVANGVSSLLVVNGAAILGGSLVINPVQGETLHFGEVLEFLSASSISGHFSTIDLPDGFRARVKVVGDPMLEAIIAPSSYTQLAQNRNQSNVATALNSFIPATIGDQLVVSTALDSLTASQYAQAFNAIMPTFYQQIATIAFNNANAQNMELNQRLWGLRVAEGGGFSMSGLADNYAMLQEGQGDGKGVLDSKKDILRPGLDNHWGMFVDGNGIFAQANSGNMLPGYNSQSGGVTTGLTYKWNDSVASGIYCGYQGTYTKSGSYGSGLGTGSSLIDNAVRFGVFGTYGAKDGKGLYANALAGGGYHNFQATRVIQFSGLERTANSAPGAGELDTMLATGYDLRNGNFTYGPTASLQYTYLGVNSLNETGAQSLNFNSGGWNSSSMLSSLGAHAAYTRVAKKDVVVVPQINLNWQHEFMQNPYAINGTLGGTSPTFANWSATPIRDFLYTGVGVTVEFGKKWNTSFFYNAAAGNSDLVSQNIFWSAGLKF